LTQDFISPFRYDGHVRMLDLEKQEFSDVITDSEDEFYDIASVKGERPLYVSSRGGFVYKIGKILFPKIIK